MDHNWCFSVEKPKTRAITSTCFVCLCCLVFVERHLTRSQILIHCERIMAEIQNHSSNSSSNILYLFYPIPRFHITRELTYNKRQHALTFTLNYEIKEANENHRHHIRKSSNQEWKKKNAD